MKVFSPLTNSHDVTLIETINTNTIIKQWKSLYDIDVSSEFHGIDEFFLYRCNQTGLYFFYPQTISGSENLYQQLQKIDWYYMPDKWEHTVAIEELKTDKCLYVLEVGSGDGFFIQQGLDSGLHIKGIELNQKAVKTAISKRLPVEYRDLEDIAVQYPETVDALCCFQVLEHIADPKTFLSNALRLLKPNGKLIISVPNCDSFLGKKNLLLDMPPHHMLRWSANSLQELENLFPLKLERVERESLAEYHITSFLECYYEYYRSFFPLSKIIFNRYSNKIYTKAMKLGLRNFFTGMTIYVSYTKLQTSR